MGIKATEGCRSGEEVGLALHVAPGWSARIGGVVACCSSPLNVKVGATIVEGLSSWLAAGTLQGGGGGTSWPVPVSLGDIARASEQLAGRTATSGCCSDLY